MRFYNRATFLQQHSRSFELRAIRRGKLQPDRRGDPEQLPAARVAWNFFRVLGAGPALGVHSGRKRPPGAQPAVLISDSL